MDESSSSSSWLRDAGNRDSLKEQTREAEESAQERSPFGDISNVIAQEDGIDDEGLDYGAPYAAASAGGNNPWSPERMSRLLSGYGQLSGAWSELPPGGTALNDATSSERLEPRGPFGFSSPYSTQIELDRQRRAEVEQTYRHLDDGPTREVRDLYPLELIDTLMAMPDARSARNPRVPFSSTYSKDVDDDMLLQLPSSISSNRKISFLDVESGGGDVGGGGNRATGEEVDAFGGTAIHIHPHTIPSQSSKPHATYLPGQHHESSSAEPRRVHFEDDGVWPLLLSRDTINNRLGHRNLSRKETLHDTYLSLTPEGALARRAKAAANSSAVRLLKRRRGGRRMIANAIGKGPSCLDAMRSTASEALSADPTKAFHDQPERCLWELSRGVGFGSTRWDTSSDRLRQLHTKDDRLTSLQDDRWVFSNPGDCLCFYERMLALAASSKRGEIAVLARGSRRTPLAKGLDAVGDRCTIACRGNVVTYVFTVGPVCARIICRRGARSDLTFDPRAAVKIAKTAEALLRERLSLPKPDPLRFGLRHLSHHGVVVDEDQDADAGAGTDNEQPAPAPSSYHQLSPAKQIERLYLGDDPGRFVEACGWDPTIWELLTAQCKYSSVRATQVAVLKLADRTRQPLPRLLGALTERVQQQLGGWWTQVNHSMQSVASDELPARGGGAVDGATQHNDGDSVVSDGDGYGLSHPAPKFFKSAFHGSLVDTVMDEWLLAEIRRRLPNVSPARLIGSHAWYYGSSGGNGGLGRSKVFENSDPEPSRLTAEPKIVEVGENADLSATDAKTAALEAAAAARNFKPLDKWGIFDLRQRRFRGETHEAILIILLLEHAPLIRKEHFAGSSGGSSRNVGGSSGGGGGGGPNATFALLPPDPDTMSLAFSVREGGRAFASSVADGELLGGNAWNSWWSSTSAARGHPRMLPPKRRPWRDAHTFITDAPPLGTIEANIQRAWREREKGMYADEEMDVVEDNIHTNVKRLTQYEEFAPGTLVLASTKSSRVRRRETLRMAHSDDSSSEGSYEDAEDEEARKEDADKAARAGLDMDLARKLQFKLKAAMYGTDPLTFFQRFDRDHGGTLDKEELRLLIRSTLKIPPREVSDAEVAKLVKALDDDGSGDLDIEELADFVDRGAATFFEGAPRANGTEEEDAAVSPSRDEFQTNGTMTGSPAGRARGRSPRRSPPKQRSSSLLLSRESPLKQEAARRHTAANKGRMMGLPFSIGHLQQLMVDEPIDDLRKQSQLTRDDGDGAWTEASDMPGLSAPTRTIFQDARDIASEIGMVGLH